MPPRTEKGTYVVLRRPRKACRGQKKSFHMDAKTKIWGEDSMRQRAAAVVDHKCILPTP